MLILSFSSTLPVYRCPSIPAAVPVFQPAPKCSFHLKERSIRIVVPVEEKADKDYRLHFSFAAQLVSELLIQWTGYFPVLYHLYPAIPRKYASLWKEVVLYSKEEDTTSQYAFSVTEYEHILSEVADCHSPYGICGCILSGCLHPM